MNEIEKNRYENRKRLVIEALNELGCYDAFVNNFASYHNVKPEEAIDIALNNGGGYVQGGVYGQGPVFRKFCDYFCQTMVSFSWGYTKEGCKYWNNIWNKLVKLSYLEHVEGVKRAMLIFKKIGTWKDILRYVWMCNYDKIGNADDIAVKAIAISLSGSNVSPCDLYRILTEIIYRCCPDNTTRWPDVGRYKNILIY